MFLPQRASSSSGDRVLTTATMVKRESMIEICGGENIVCWRCEPNPARPSTHTHTGANPIQRESERSIHVTADLGTEATSVTGAQRPLASFVTLGWVQARGQVGYLTSSRRGQCAPSGRPLWVTSLCIHFRNTPVCVCERERAHACMCDYSTPLIRNTECQGGRLCLCYRQ